MSSNALKSIFAIKKEELPFSILMSLYFFFVITSFWILKPIKKALFIDYYKELGGLDLFSWHLLGSQAELIAKVLNMVVAAVAVIVFTILSRRFQREKLTVIFSIFFIACYLLYATLLSSPQGITVWTFYLFGDLFSTLMVATFFVFLNDSVTSDAAKRLYGLIGFGGVAGGVFGTTSVRALLTQVSNTGWMFVLAVIGLVISGIAVAAGRRVSQFKKISEEKISNDPDQSIIKGKGNPAIEGAKLVFSSKYLLGIVGIVGLYEMVSTIMDFQFSASVEHFVQGSTREHFATVFAITNSVAMFVQLFLTSFVMTRFGVGMALLVLPVTAMLGSFGFLLVPVLLMGSALNTADNAFSYSINQSAKESLYVPTTKDEKYRAKAFIDMFVQRFAKAAAVGLSLLISTYFAGDFSAIRWLSLLTAAILILWLYVARITGKRFDELTAHDSR